MGLQDDTEESSYEELQDRPLYYWLKSFAGRELDHNAPFPEFVSSNALSYALEYIGITSENEQSSLHLSAIFDEESQQGKNKYPTHYESETKSRIQHFNRVFLELKSHFEDHYSQIVTIRPPNSVHITSACGSCSIQEFEKLLFLILGAAIHGTQKQDTIRKIKRFPAKIQESLIECIKLIADSLEVITVKSWAEFQSLSEEEQKKIYENLLNRIRKMVIERNELIQNQLLMDYFAGHMNCDQKRLFDSRGYSVALDGEKSTEDVRLTNSMRHLREQLHEKSELLQECRVELEIAKNRIQELERDMNDFHQRHRLMRKARDELDALREGQEKASRLEAELSKMKAKLEETEHIYERVETLEIENRNLQLKHDMLLDQISFLSLEKTSRDTSFDYLSGHAGFLDGLGLDHKMKDDEENFFDTDDEEPSVKENPSISKSIDEEECEEDEEEQLDEDKDEESPELNLSGSSTVKESPVDDNDDEEIIERPTNLDISQTESVDDAGTNLVASTPTTKPTVELKSQEVQTPTISARTKRLRRRSSLLNVKRTRRAIIIPFPGSQKLPISAIDKLAGSSSQKQQNSSQTIQVFKVYNMQKRKGSSRPKKFKCTVKTPVEVPDQSVPNVDNEGNEADEELSLSPTGNRNESDLDSINNDKTEGTDNDSEIYFVCSPPNSTGTTTPRKSHFGTTTAFPMSNGQRHTPRSLHQNTVDFDIDSQPPLSHHSNHLTMFNRNRAPSPPSTVHIPVMQISHEVQIGPSDTDEALNDEDASNDFSYGDYNIQLNLRNGSIKPALINKITTLSANLSPDHNSNNQYQPHHLGINRHTTYVETSSEEDGSVWYEYGCV